LHAVVVVAEVRGPVPWVLERHAAPRALDLRELGRQLVRRGHASNLRIGRRDIRQPPGQRVERHQREGTAEQSTAKRDLDHGASWVEGMTAFDGAQQYARGVTAPCGVRDKVMGN